MTIGYHFPHDKDNLPSTYDGKMAEINIYNSSELTRKMQ